MSIPSSSLRKDSVISFFDKEPNHFPTYSHWYILLLYSISWMLKNITGSHARAYVFFTLKPTNMLVLFIEWISVSVRLSKILSQNVTQFTKFPVELFVSFKLMFFFQKQWAAYQALKWLGLFGQMTLSLTKPAKLGIPIIFSAIEIFFCCWFL